MARTGQVAFVRVRLISEDKHGGSPFGDTIQVEPIKGNGESDGSTVWVDPDSIVTESEIRRKIRGNR